MMDRIRGMKSTLVGYEKLLNGFNAIPLDYFKQWYSYDFHLNHFKALIAEIIINRKPIIANKSTAAALAQIISGLLKHESYYECNLSEQYEINALEIDDSETIIFNKFFNSKRSLDDFLKLDNLNRNSIKLFTITKSGLEENKDLIKDRFIFFDYILEPLNEYEKYNKLDVDWTSIKWYSSYDYVSNLNLFPLRKNDIELNMLSAALIYRPTIKRLYPELLQRFDWVNSNYKPGIIEEIRRYLNLVKHI